MLLVSCIWGPITVALLFARLWVRIFHQRNPGWDDWLMLAAIVRESRRWSQSSLTSSDSYHCIDHTVSPQ